MRGLFRQMAASRSARRPDRVRPASAGAAAPDSSPPFLPGELLRQVRRLEIHTRALVSEVFAGEYHSVFKGRGMEFAEVREYTPGDDIRAIDWNVTARYGAPFVKRYVEERELTVFLIVDASGSQGFGAADRSKIELAAEVGALLAFAAIGNKDKVGLLVFTDRVELVIPPRKSRSHGLRLVRDMLGFRPQSTGTDIGLACETAYHALRRRSVVFLLSDFLVSLAPLERPLGALARRHDVIAVTLTDPLERGWPDLGLVEWEDLESGERKLVDTTERKVRDAIAASYARHRENVGGFLRRHAIDEVRLELGKDPVAPLLAFFKLRERRLARE